MQDFIDRHVEKLVVQAYATAYTHHGDLGLELEAFSTYLYLIIEKRLGMNAPAHTAFNFVNSLHMNDLYLTLACAQGSEVAWRRFASVYDPCIRRICDCICLSKDAAREIADNLPGQLFLPNAAGRSRIVSYEGLSSLSTWLAVIIKHRAIRQRRIKSINIESLDQITDVADEASIFKIEATLRAGKYELPIRDSLRGAVNLLSDRERLILRMRYEQELQVSQIARLMGVGPSAITRQLDRTREKLREGITSILATGHRLDPVAIEECVSVLLDDQGHSILAFNKEK